MKWIFNDFLYQPNVRKHLSVVFAGFLLGTLVYSFIHFSEFQNTTELLLSGFLGIIVAYLAYFSNTLLNAFIPWKLQPGLRLLAGILLHLILGLLLIYSAIWGYGRLFQKPSIFLGDYEDVRMKIGILLFCIALVYNIIYFALYSYHQYVRGQVLELQLERKQTQLQLNALKSQLSPHFLFNSMNTLSSLFQKNIREAETFIRALANSYQYTLNKYEDPLVTVAEELSFVDAYCLLIKTRFGDHLAVDIQLPPSVLQSKIPPLTLQMLVENAVKHNVMSSSQPLHLRITTEANKLCVSNNKTSKRPKIDSLKIGLHNIASRYELLVNKSIEVIDTKNFEVQLPLIP